MTMVVFSVFFGKLAHVPSDGMPYPLFAFAALMPWTYFAAALGGGAAVGRRQSAPDHEGLFSAAAHSARGGRRRRSSISRSRFVDAASR